MAPPGTDTTNPAADRRASISSGMIMSDGDAETPAAGPGPDADAKETPRTPADMASPPTGGPLEPQGVSPDNASDATVSVPALARWVILFNVCWLSVPMIFGTSAALGVAPEIAGEFGVEETTISIANAGVFVAMACSPLIWNPLTRILGRRNGYLLACCIMGLCALGSALAHNMALFTAVWVIGGSTGVIFLVSGQTIIADIFEPTKRGTAVGFFLGTTVSANAIAPLSGGVITTFTTWRVIYWVQAAMTLIGLILSWFYVPKDVTPRINIGFRTDKPASQCFRDLARAFSPMPVFRAFTYPNILLADIACGLLSFNQYGLLSAIRYSINGRFNLTSPLTSGLFYLAPGGGFILGSTIGGRISDHTVKRWVRKRNGLRLPRDRLRSGLGAMVVVLPVGTLLYGWSLDREFGAMALPAASSFVAGAGLMWAFSGMNTYAAEVLPPMKTECISSKYIVQYVLGAATIATRVPMMDAIGVGWSFTITAVMGFLSGGIVFFLTRYAAKTEKKNDEPRN